MSTLTIRGVDDELKTQLRVRAARHGRSMAAEVRAILHEALTAPAPPERLGSHIHQRFVTMGGVELDLPERRELPQGTAAGMIITDTSIAVINPWAT